jgi:hypothetical protein
MEEAGKRGFILSHRCQAVAAALERAYAAYYDIEPVDDGTPLRAVCAYHMRDSQYVLVKSAELWAAESHEYLYLWTPDRLDLPTLEKIFQRVLDDGEPRVRPHAQHMYTYLTAVVLYDSADPEALAQLKKLKKRREFKLSLHGWMELRIAAVDLSADVISTNRCARDLIKSLRPFVDTVLKSV